MAGKQPEVFHLANGMRVLYHRLPHSRLVHCGVMVNVGSRHEQPSENGVAHLVEHGVFKGTRQRRPYHILTRMENVGGEVDAYTSRDKTGYTTSAPSRYAGRALELLTDMLFQPTFPEAEMQKEKQVVREELEMYEDTPEESLMDEFHRLQYPEQPLGHNILGTRESLEGLRPADLQRFHQQYYRPENMVVAIVGKVTPRRLAQLIRQYLEPIPASTAQSQPGRQQVPLAPQPGFQECVSKDFQQTYCMLGVQAYARNDPRYYALHVLNALLGGTDMSARLNLRLREQHGYVYQIDTAYLPYADTGLFTIDFSTERKNYKRCLTLIHQELEKVRQWPPGKVQLNRAKRQLLGQASMLEEDPPALMQDMARGLLNHGQVQNYETYAANINAVRADDLSGIATELFEPDRISQLTYMPGAE